MPGYNLKMPAGGRVFQSYQKLLIVGVSLLWWQLRSGREVRPDGSGAPATPATWPAVLSGEGRPQEAAAQLPAGSTLVVRPESSAGRSEAKAAGTEAKSNARAARHWQVADVMRQRVDCRRLREMPAIEHQPCIDKNE